MDGTNVCQVRKVPHSSTLYSLSYEGGVGYILVKNHKEVSMKDIVLSKIDHSILKATSTESDVLKASKDVIRYGFATVCVFPKHVNVARQVLPIQRISTVISFPLSSVDLNVKLFEIGELIKICGEFDVVVDISSVKSGNWKRVENELSEIRKLTAGRVIKLIFECCYLTNNEKKRLCRMAVDADWDYLKTSTGYGTYGAKPSDVKLLLSCAKGRAKVKAAGGIRTYKQALNFVRLGADRIGTSSGVSIAEEMLHGREV